MTVFLRRFSYETNLSCGLNFRILNSQLGSFVDLMLKFWEVCILLMFA